MDLNDAMAAAWKELAGEPEGQPVTEVQEEQTVSETTDDSTVETASGQTAEDTTPDTPTDKEEVQEEGESTDEDADADEPEGEAVALDEEALVTYKGKTAKASDLFEMKADYTKKTQALAAEREAVSKQAEEVTRVYDEMVSWYKEKTAKPVDWLAEIATETGDATKAVALLINQLNEAGQLDPRFAEVFDLKAPDNPVNKIAGDASTEARIRELEAEREAARVERERAAEEAEVQASIEQQVFDLLEGEGVKFKSDREFRQFKIDLFETATNAGITDLKVAYELMQSRAEKSRAAEQRKKDALEKKRAQRVVSKPEPAAATADADRRYSTVDEAARAAMDAFFTK